MQSQSPAVASSPQATTVPPRYAARAAKIFLISILLGPLIGGWIFFAVVVLAKGQLQALTLADTAKAVMLSGLVGYVMGITRAAAAGGWVAYRVWRDGTVGYLETAAAAAVVSLVGVAYLAIDYEPMGAAVTLGFLLGALAVTAALVCRWIAGAMGILPR